MNIKQMIEENNKLQDAMSPENLSYYQDMIVYIRSSRMQEAKSEELLLEIAQHLLEAQDKGRTARDVFGSDPEAYCKELVEQLPKMNVLGALQFHLMVPWIVLTWFFFVQAAAGFITMWVGGPIERMTQVRVSSLLFIAGGSYILIHMLLLWLKKDAFRSDKNQFTVKIRYMGLYMAGLAAILIGGICLGDALPVLTVAPWVSLVIFVIGLAGKKLLFSVK